MVFRFSLLDWSAWAPGVESREAWKSWAVNRFPLPVDGEPALPGIPAMLRRRADRLSRMALRVSCEVLGNERGIPVVLVSRHGSVGRSATLLADLAAANPISAAGFASSVHNASLGLLGIARADPAPCVALAAGDGRVAAMLAEVAGLLSDGHPRVLGVLCDEPPPGFYQPYVGTEESALAWAGLFGVAGEGEMMTLEPGEGAAAAGNPALAWLGWLLSSNAELECSGLGSSWKVRRGV